MMVRVYLVKEQCEDSEPEVNVFASREEAIDFAEVKLHQMCKVSGGIRRYNVSGFVYFGLSLKESILVTVEEKNVVYNTSGATAVLDHTPGWPPQ